MVVTDYGSIGNIRTQGLEPLPDASVEALKAGTDMDMCSNGFLSTLKQSLAEGKIDIKDIDRAVRRVLEAKYRLGLFDDPYKYNDTEREKRLIYSKEHRDEARAIAAKTFVLLKNENALLPLEKKGKIALIGPLADAACEMPGTWSVAADCSKYKTLKQALGEALDGKASLLYAQGARFDTTPLADRRNNGNDTDSITDMRLLNEALDIASKADVIVAALGEDSGRSGESSSLTDLSLPAAQRRLLEALLSTGKPVVMLNFAGRPTVLTWESENVPAILNVWFGGSEAPDAIADIIFGDVNPSGKLSASMPWNVGQIPVYYNHLNTSHPIDENNPRYQKFRSNYIDAPNEPLYPFGYGLSYTDFEYSGFRIDGNELREDKPLTATVTVTNTGRREGDEIVQFYIRDVQASVARPVKELKHFERISLKPGEKRDVSFKITPDDLKFYNRNLEYVAEPGEFQVMAGPDSKHVSTLSFSLAE
jgi:beta-glucosidase